MSYPSIIGAWWDGLAILSAPLYAVYLMLTQQLRRQVGTGTIIQQRLMDRALERVAVRARPSVPAWAARIRARESSAAMTIKLLPFFIAQFLGSLADQFLLFAVPLMIFKITGSIAWSGLAFSLEWLPRILSFPVAGAAVDRFGSKSVYLTADMIRFTGCGGALLGLVWAPDYSYAFLVALAVLNGFFYEHAFMAIETAAKKLSPPEHIQKTQSILQGLDQTSLLLGPALAAFFIVFIDLPYILLTASAAFLASFITIVLTRVPELIPERLASRRLFIREMKEGLATFIGIPRLVVLVLLTNLLNLMAAILLISGPAITTGIFEKPESYYGLMNTLSGLVGIVTVAITLQLGKRFEIQKIRDISFFMACAACLTAGLSPTFWIYASTYAVFMSMVSVFTIGIRTERARIIPPERFGSTLGFVVLLNLVPLPLSGTIVAIATQFIHLQTLVTGLAILCLVVSIPLFQQLSDRAILNPVEKLRHQGTG